MAPTPRFALPFLLLALGLGGCVSSKYKMAGKDTPPAKLLELKAEETAAQAVLRTVVVYQGPGSWKKAAYWDEYVVSVRNPGPAPLTITGAELTDIDSLILTPGENPWELEKQSKARLKNYRESGRPILIGAGVTLLWVASVDVAAGMALGLGGSTALAAGAATVLVGVPLWAIGSGVRTLVARDAINDEFGRRRAHLPMTLEPGTERTVSFFFPVAPGPKKLTLRHRSGEAAGELSFDLAPLAGLHLKPAEPTPRR